MLLAYAAHEFRLARRVPGGGTEREHLEAAARMTGQIMPELESPFVPDWLMYLWTWFGELRAGVNSTMGHAPIGWSDLAAWASLTGRSPTPWEVSVLRSLDRVLREQAGSKT